MGKDKHKDGETAATSKTNRDTQDLSRDREARDATLAQTIAEAVTREVAKAHAHYQAILNEKSTPTLQTSLKISSGANGFKVMDPFDWIKDKSIYQRWQLCHGGRFRGNQDFLLPSLDQWRGNGTH